MGRTAVILGITNNNRVTKNALVPAPKDGQGTVGRNFLKRLNVVEIITELGPLVFLAFHHGDVQLAFLPDKVPQAAQQLGILGKPLHQNVAGAIQGSLGIFHAGFFVQVALGSGFRIESRIIIEGVSQRLQTRLAGNLGLGPALGLVGQVKIFQTVLGVGVLDGGLELVGQLALLLNALEDSGTTVFQFPQIAQTFFQVPQLAVIQ